jgi:hypothetical protein
MADPDLFVSIGIKMQDLVAGLAGGVVNAFVFQRSNPVAIVGSVIVGALTAAYLTEPAGKITGTSGGATAFIVGLGAMAICQAILGAISKWKPKGGADV